MEDICGYYLDKQATIKRFFDVCNFYGIKNKDLAKLFNVSDVIVSYWRTGKRFPKWDNLMLFAYTVGLPLEVMIIGKQGIQDPQLMKAINRIDSLREKKYISNLQELLDNGELDFPPLIGEGIFNPLEDRIDFLDYTSTQYAKLCADVQYYGLKKRSPKQDKSSKDSFETSIYECSWKNPIKNTSSQLFDEKIEDS